VRAKFSTRFQTGLGASQPAVKWVPVFFSGGKEMYQTKVVGKSKHTFYIQ
jgi:hypothetical protein